MGKKRRAPKRRRSQRIITRNGERPNGHPKDENAHYPIVVNDEKTLKQKTGWNKIVVKVSARALGIGIALAISLLSVIYGWYLNSPELKFMAHSITRQAEVTKGDAGFLASGAWIVLITNSGRTPVTVVGIDQTDDDTWPPACIIDPITINPGGVEPIPFVFLPDITPTGQTVNLGVTNRLRITLADGHIETAHLAHYDLTTKRHLINASRRQADQKVSECLTIMRAYSRDRDALL